MAITVDIAHQTLTLDTPTAHYSWPVSTALRGTGQQDGSFQTPLGQHRIVAKIGDDLPARAVLKGRCFTGEEWTPNLTQTHPCLLYTSDAADE